MTEMIRRFLRQKSSSVGTLIALALLALLAALPLNSGQGFASLDTMAVLLLASGSVSRDVASGAVQMILARPIRRTDYLAGRYLGILIGVALFLAGAILLASALNAVVARLQPVASWSSFSFAAACRSAAGAFLEGALIAAILLFFSTFLRGWGDALALIVSTILLGSMRALGQALRLPLLSKVGEVLKENLAPTVRWETVVRGEGVFGSATGRYLFVLALFWTLTAVVFSRREFSYAHE